MRAPVIIVIGLAAVFGVVAAALIVSEPGSPEGAAVADAGVAETATDRTGAVTTEDAFTRFERAQSGRLPADRQPIERTQDEVQRREGAQDEPSRFERAQEEPSRFERAQEERPQADTTKYEFKQVQRTTAEGTAERTTDAQRARTEPERTAAERTTDAQRARTVPERAELERTAAEPERIEPAPVEPAQAERTQTRPSGEGLRPGQLEDPGPIRFYRGGWRTDFTISSVPFTDIRGGGPPKDGIPAIDVPIYESIDAARSWLDGQSPVIALEIDGEARAYPMGIMTWHEIVNDSLGGSPVAVTFCPLCNTALAFERTLDGVVHDFGTSGNLYLSNLVMYDRQTETWWQQSGGHAIVGELMGAQLELLAAQIISLDDFEATWPDGDVLSRETGYVRPYGENPYPGYDRADQPAWNFHGTTDGRIAPKERVATVGEGDQAIAFAYPDLANVGVATESISGEPVVVFWTPGTFSALDAKVIDESEDIGATGAFSPVVDGRVLEFERLGATDTPITDRETGSSWSITGVATDGPLTGTRLEPVVSANHLWFSWAAFNPETRIWRPPSS